jgi:hypothetical protein
MVTIIGYHQRQNAEGETFLVLELEGSLEIIKSKAGKSYATTRKCKLPCTFSEETAIRLIGTQLEGFIEKVGCEPYEYTVPNSSETVTLYHSYTYVPEQGEKMHINSSRVMEVI